MGACRGDRCSHGSALQPRPRPAPRHTSASPPVLHQPLRAPALPCPQVVTDLLVKAGSGTPAERLQSATQLAALLEAEEARYQDVVGGPHLQPNQRAQFSIGKALAALKVGRRGRSYRRGRRRSGRQPSQAPGGLTAARLARLPVKPAVVPPPRRPRFTPARRTMATCTTRSCRAGC
jgi:hypothetical protein